MTHEKELIHLGLRILGQAGKQTTVQRPMRERFERADLELMGVWRSACAMGLYSALNDIDEMQAAAWSIRQQHNL